MPRFTDPRTFKYADQSPNITSSKSIESRMLVASFGEGYEQIAEDGINAHRVIWDLEFGGLTEASANLLVEEATLGQTLLVTYTVFGDQQRTYRVVPGSISQNYTSAHAASVAFQLREVFDVDSNPDQPLSLVERL